jgi:hypothetical protein
LSGRRGAGGVVQGLAPLVRGWNARRGRVIDTVLRPHGRDEHDRRSENPDPAQAGHEPPEGGYVAVVETVDQEADGDGHGEHGHGRANVVAMDEGQAEGDERDEYQERRTDQGDHERLLVPVPNPVQVRADESSHDGEDNELLRVHVVHTGGAWPGDVAGPGAPQGDSGSDEERYRQQRAGGSKGPRIVKRLDHLNTPRSERNADGSMSTYTYYSTIAL